MDPEREIPQRELRNDISRILDEVAHGQRVRVTVRGRAVADLVPVRNVRSFVPRAELLDILRLAPLDAGFADEMAGLIGDTIEDL